MQGRLRVLLLMLSDAICLYGVWAFLVWGYWAVGIANYKFGFGFYCSLWPIGIAFIGINALFKLYHGRVPYPSAPLSPVEELKRLVGAAFITHVGLLGYLVMMYQTSLDYSRFVVAMSGVLTALLAQPMRDLFRWVMFRTGIGRLPVVLSGSGATAEEIADILSKDAYCGFKVSAWVKSDFKSLLEVGRQTDSRILVTCQDIRLLKVQLQELTAWYRYIECIPSAEVFPVYGSRTVLFGGMGGIEMVNQRGMDILRMEKWFLDKSLTVLTFVLLSPLFVVIPVLILLTSKGGVFYRQSRLGLRGKPIKVLKFRSMYVDAEERLKRLLKEDPALAEEWERNHKLARDPRVTPLGRFLRKTSLDEIPQLVNVFWGDMALVGPRPIVKDEVERYGAAYEIFSSVKPGVTGLWQVSGRSETNYARRVALDTQYVLNWSPWVDIWILFRTVGAVLFMRGAC